MLKNRRGSLTGAEVDAAIWQASSSPNSKFGLHQLEGGNCHQKSRLLMGWINAYISSSLLWTKMEKGEVTDVILF